MLSYYRELPVFLKEICVFFTQYGDLFIGICHHRQWLLQRLQSLGPVINGAVLSLLFPIGSFLSSPALGAFSALSTPFNLRMTQINVKSQWSLLIPMTTTEQSTKWIILRKTYRFSSSVHSLPIFNTVGIAVACNFLDIFHFKTRWSCPINVDDFKELEWANFSAALEQKFNKSQLLESHGQPKGDLLCWELK